MRLVLILLLALWGTSAVLAAAHTGGKGSAAQITAAYLLLWPVLALILFFNEPVPLWLILPTTFGALPWLLAFAHLKRVLRDPGQARFGPLGGVRLLYWVLGAGIAFVIGLILE
ncbi:hypothetical protein ABC977_00030 [Thioalkalicoccus limnaeus]|uniref:Uncharacterized protein n=1 Tax=Thioalkalicoccus limnaeus TaxID=120681 RepID=A0ABV4B908_9GAMM